MINVGELALSHTQLHCTALMALHAYSGCDTTSAFKGLRKIKPIKTLSKMPKYAPILARLGDSWTVPEDLFNDLDEFTCALYGRPRMRRVDDVRFHRMKELCAKDNLSVPSKIFDMGSLPSCRAERVLNNI